MRVIFLPRDIIKDILDFVSRGLAAVGVTFPAYNWDLMA